MPNQTVTKWLILGLTLLAMAQALWIFLPASTPELTSVNSVTPIGKHSAVYEVLSDSGGATVSKLYLYFIAVQQPDQQQLLETLKSSTPFLVTKQAGAISAVDGSRIFARTRTQVYSYSSTAVLRENNSVSTVTVELNATLGD
nr:hypothetical protein [uncultured Pseudomonas sp.]